MPYSALQPCRSPNCPNLAEGGRYCSKHADRKTKDDSRPSAAKRGYGRNWQKVRAEQLKREPLCRDIFGVHKAIGVVVQAQEVDHILPLSQGGTNHTDNLRSLCKSCHSRRTATEQGRVD